MTDGSSEFKLIEKVSDEQLTEEKAPVSALAFFQSLSAETSLSLDGTPSASP